MGAATGSGGRAGEPRVKGLAFRTVELCFVELCGAPAREKAMELMDRQVAEAYRYGTLLSASWYPVSWYREVFRALRAATGAGPDLARRIGGLAVEHDMRGAHKRLLAWLSTPQTLLRLSQRVFNTYYDTGHLEVVASEESFVRVRAGGCVGWDANMWSELAGSCEALLTAAGARHVRVRGVGGGRDGDDHHELEARWAR